MPKNMIVVIAAGLPFACMAALSVFFLSYREYSRHYSDGKMPMKLSLESAFFTLLFFCILLLVLGYILSHMFGG
jgi:hypothetical protein